MMTFYIFIILGLLFFVSLNLGNYLSKHFKVFKDLGVKIYDQKEEQLKTSPMFSIVREALKKKAFTPLFVFIFIMILLKSIFMVLFSVFLIAPLVMLFQGIMTGSLLSHTKKVLASVSTFKVIILWQFASHLAGAAVGTIVGYKWLFSEHVKLSFQLFADNQYFLIYIFMILTAIVAAYKESNFIFVEYGS